MNCAAYELTAPAQLERRREDDARTDATVAKHIERFYELARHIGARLPGARA